ncbi:MAG: carboxypeptidase regulatory-like domain-containing protein [Candidatus Rokubacteria bacterium]|nr:carboxypeptidase regulatory-like domain-containing protein [Candidatus Rokubacteria bacterium]
MKTTKALYVVTIAAAVAALLAAGQARLSAQQNTDPAIRIGGDDLGGVVISANGPEAGVWVIAETTELPTKFAKIVVTDEQGRYVMPGLPKATYSVWVRGYGLIDSPKVQTAPGKIVNPPAVVAPSAAAAVEYYPAIYWYSMLKVPDKSEFPGTGPSGNGMPVALKSQARWLDIVKTNGCYGCHQLGNKATRTIPKELGHFNSSTEAWARRIVSGQAMTQMTNNLGRLDVKRAPALFADWTDRIAAGELPASRPSRPQGVERNVVITLWDWAGPKDYLHDEVSTDKRNPRVNANGLIFGATEESTDLFPVLDPVLHKATQVRMPVRDPNTPSSKANPMTPSPYWGAEPIWDSQTSMHNPMFDEKGRVWFTSRVRPPENPEFCKKGSDHPSAKLFPVEQSNRHLSMYDPKTGKITLISTCFPTHHLVFAEDANNTLWTSAGGPQSGVIGWLNRRMFEKTGDEVKSQGWTALILDTNGNGKRDDYVEPNQPVDPTKDKRITAAFYGVAVNPVDGTVWGTVLGFPGYVIRVNPGANPPATALAEVFEPPLPGYGPRGMDIDRGGVVWAPLSSGHLGSFDRRKCKGPLNGPTATGKHCPEGWTLYPFPGPQLANVTDSGSAEASYYTWVDQHDTFGLGKNVPLATGNANESLIALVDGKFVNLRVPYPMGFFTKWMDGRIDDPNSGWKGRGLWSTYSTRAPFHVEGGKGTTSKVVKFQLRPDPLAR